MKVNCSFSLVPLWGRAACPSSTHTSACARRMVLYCMPSSPPLVSTCRRTVTLTSARVLPVCSARGETHSVLHREFQSLRCRSWILRSNDNNHSIFTNSTTARVYLSQVDVPNKQKNQHPTPGKSLGNTSGI